MESFISSLKREELYRTNYHSIQEMRACIEEYIEFYNTKRTHTTLGYKTPDAWERSSFERQNQIEK